MMSRSLVSALGAVVLLSLMTALAFAGNPDPASSSLVTGNRIATSPVNHLMSGVNQYEVIFNLNDGVAPVEGFPASQLELDFVQCLGTSSRPANQIPADGPSDVNGDVVWKLNLGFGGADPCAITILVQNVPFTLPQHEIPGQATDAGGGLRSPDFDGNHTVNLVDLGFIQPAFVACLGAPPGPCGPSWVGDLLLDNDRVALVDIGVFQAHFSALIP